MLRTSNDYSSSRKFIRAKMNLAPRSYSHRRIEFPAERLEILVVNPSRHAIPSSGTSHVFCLPHRIANAIQSFIHFLVWLSCRYRNRTAHAITRQSPIPSGFTAAIIVLIINHDFFRHIQFSKNARVRFSFPYKYIIAYIGALRKTRQ